MEGGYGTQGKWCIYVEASFVWRKKLTSRVGLLENDALFNGDKGLLGMSLEGTPR